MLYPRENEVRAVLDLSGIWKFQLGDAGIREKPVRA